MKNEKLFYFSLCFFPCRRQLLQLLIDTRAIGSTHLLAASWSVLSTSRLGTFSFPDVFLNKFKFGVKPE